MDFGFDEFVQFFAGEGFQDADGCARQKCSFMVGEFGNEVSSSAVDSSAQDAVCCQAVDSASCKAVQGVLQFRLSVFVFVPFGEEAVDHGPHLFPCRIFFKEALSEIFEGVFRFFVIDESMDSFVPAGQECLVERIFRLFPALDGSSQGRKSGLCHFFIVDGAGQFSSGKEEPLEETSLLLLLFPCFFNSSGEGFLRSCCLRFFSDQRQKFLQPFFTAEELKVICQPLDFFGFNCYNASNYEEYMGPNPAVTPGMPRTAMDWPITPDALYLAARFLTERYHLPIIVTENGMANIDFVMSDGAVHDPQRIDFVKRYLAGLQRAVDENIPVTGYLYWSIMDNFEWAEGYDKRFGLVYVDYQTQQRIPKDSFYWYADVIKNNRIS